VAEELIVLGTPIFGGPIDAGAVAQIESVPGVRFVQMTADGRLHTEAAGAEVDLAAARVLFRGGTPTSVLEHVLARAPNIAWIHSFSAGVERVATPAVRERRLLVTNARGVFSRPIAEYLVMMLLAVARRLPQLLELQRERTWQPLRARELSDMTVGIIGFGSIGAELARLLEPFGTRIVAVRRHPERGAEGTQTEIHGADALDDVLRAADAIVLTAPLTGETQDLIGPRELSVMRPGAWLYNIARGRLIDERALRAALSAGSIGGAVLDVFRDEPLPPDSPLYDTPNLIITPHTSWASDQVVRRSFELFVGNLRRFVAGEPLDNLVDLDAGY
jgi:phosphoglycerate dehydrogenase-like enzyme